MPPKTSLSLVDPRLNSLPRETLPEISLPRKRTTVRDSEVVVSKSLFAPLPSKMSRSPPLSEASIFLPEPRTSSLSLPAIRFKSALSTSRILPVVSGSPIRMLMPPSSERRPRPTIVEPSSLKRRKPPGASSTTTLLVPGLLVTPTLKLPSKKLTVLAKDSRQTRLHRIYRTFHLLCRHMCSF